MVSAAERSSFSSQFSGTETKTRKDVNSKLKYISHQIQKHLRGEKKMHLTRVNKFAKTLRRMENNVYLTDKTSVSTAKNILLRIRKQLSADSKSLKTQYSKADSIGWRTRSTNKFMELGLSKRKKNQYNSLLGSLCNSEDSSLPDILSLGMLTNDNFFTQQQTQECDVSMDVQTSSSPAATIFQKEQVSMTSSNTQPSSMQIDTESEFDNSTSSEEITDYIQNSNFQESQTAQTNTSPQTFEAENSSPAPMSTKTTSDETQMSTTRPKSGQIGSISQLGNSSISLKDISDYIPFPTFEESEADQPDVESSVEHNLNEPSLAQMSKKIMSDETGQMSTTQLGNSLGNSSSLSPEDISNYIPTFQESQADQPNVESSANQPSFHEEHILNEPSSAQMAKNISSDEKEQISTTYTDSQPNSLQIGSKSHIGNNSSSISPEDISESIQISNFEESQALVPNIESNTKAENTSNGLTETSQHIENNFESNFMTYVGRQMPTASPAPSNASYLDHYKSFLENSHTHDSGESLNSDSEEFQQEESSIPEETDGDLFENLDKELSVVTQVINDIQITSYPVTRTDPVTIDEEQQFTLFEATQNQTTNNSFSVTESSQRNLWQANVNDNSDEGIFLSNQHSINQQSIIAGSQQTNYFDANVPLPENETAKYFQLFDLNPEQTNDLDADEIVQENMDQPIHLHVSLVKSDDMDLTDAEICCSIEGDVQKEKETNSPVPESQASFVFGMPKPEGFNEFPPQQLFVTQTNDEFESNTETIVPETIYTQSQGIHSKSPRIKSPYKNHRQSSSFLTYKATAKSQASLATPKRSSSFSTSSGDIAITPSGTLSSKQEPSRNIVYYPASESSNQEQSPNTIVKDISQLQELQSQNLVLINGCIQEHSYSKSKDLDETLYSEKEEKLIERVIKRRERHTNEEWNGLPISEKVSGTYADKFHVSIFNDPVEALTNIRYKPCFSSFTFPRLTIKEVHDEITRMANDSRIMETILEDIVDKLEDQNCLDPGLNFSKRLGIVECTEESDSSDDERKANRRWLREYRAKTNTQSRRITAEPDKEKPNFTSRCDPIREMEKEKTEVDNDEALIVDLMAKLGGCKWLENENV